MSASDTNTCPTCGAEIPAAAPAGMCPKCLLGDALPASAPAVNDDATVLMDSPPELSPAAKAARERKADSPSPHDPKKGAQQFAPPIEDLAKLLPDLEILELLGAGGMGAVYKARQPRLDRFVALKILSCPAEYHDNFALRFEREAQLLAKLNHPNIVTLYDFGELERSEEAEENNLFYFMMEFVDGADLSRLIHDGGLEPDQALRLVPQICDALQFAHDEGITHRDIKPANILVDKKGNVRIADFGLAKLIATEQEEAMMTGLTMTGTSMGTPHYMAPEQWDAPEKVDHRADIYSLGVVFYEMLTGSRPHGVFTPPSETAQVDDRIDTVVLKAMEKEPELRYQQASEVKEDVTRVVSEPVEVVPASKSRTGLWVGVCLAVVAVVGVVIWQQGFAPEVEEKEPDAPEAQTLPGSAASGTEAFDSTERDYLLPPAANPGPLHASGVLRYGQPIDLDQAGGMDDFVEVMLDDWGWVGLRETGEVIHSKWGRRPETNVKRLLPGLYSYGMIDEDGKLSLVGNTPEEEGKNTGISRGVLSIPDDVQRIGVVDAAWSAGIAIARLRDGSARVWGERYEKEFAGEQQWSPPPTEALEQVVDVAISQVGCATLTTDGTLYLWGPDFVESEFPLLDGKVVEIESAGSIRVLLDNGQLFGFLAKHGMEGQKIAEGVEEIADNRILRSGAERWEYLHSFAAFNPLVSAALDDVPLLSPRQFAVGPLYQPKGGEREAGVVWIEPASSRGIEPAGSGDANSSSTAKRSPIPSTSSGRLRAVGSTPGHDSPDLSKVDGITDLIEVAGRVGDWVALRANGETISAQGKADFSGIRKIGWSFAGNIALIDDKGAIRYPEKLVDELPPESGGVSFVDVKLGKEHGIALAEDGRAFVFGKRYEEQVGDPTDGAWHGTPKWPRPPADALTDVAAIAVTTTHAATLKSNGTLSVFGWGGLLDLEMPKELGKIVDVGCSEDLLLLLDPNGRAWKLPLPRNPAPDQPVLGHSRFYALSSKDEEVVALHGECWLESDGSWRHQDAPEEGLLRETQFGSGIVPVVDGGVFDKNRYVSLLWIEPASRMPKTERPVVAGELRVAGEFKNGTAPDLTRAKGIDDFVQVLVNDVQWYALRSNGVLVSSQNGPHGRQNVERILKGYFASVGLVAQDGTLSLNGYEQPTEVTHGSISSGVRSVPAEVQEVGVEDAVWLAGFALAKLRDGTARVWGERYEREFAGEPQWKMPPAEALEGVVDIARGVSSCATLTRDGTLHLWGHQVGESPRTLGPQSLSGERVVEIKSGWNSLWALTSGGRLLGIGGPYPWTGEERATGIETMNQGLILRDDGQTWESLDPESVANASVRRLLGGLGPMERNSFSVNRFQLEGGKEGSCLLWIEADRN